MSLVCIAWLCGGNAYASGKCGPLLFRIKGETKTHSSNQKILVTIAPEPNRSSPLVLREGDRFYADVYYDPFKSHSNLFGDNCTKRPDSVTVALVENGKEVDKKQLSFSKDFVQDRDGGYVLRKNLRLGK
jgi:hypothetical protein